MFGGGSIDKQAFEWIVSNIKPGSCIVEFGSGETTAKLCELYTVYSVEDNQKYMNKYPTHYLYAPIKDMWYDPSFISLLPKSYDFILIDGPSNVRQRKRRHGFLYNLHLFKTDIPMLFDDVQRPDELDLLVQVAQKVNRPYFVYKYSKSFGVIP